MDANSTTNHVVEPGTTALHMASALEKKFRWMRCCIGLFGDGGTPPLILTAAKGAITKVSRRRSKKDSSMNALSAVEYLERAIGRRFRQKG